MKVKELIAILSGYPPNTEVLLGSDMGLGGVEEVKVITVLDRADLRYMGGKYVDYANIDDHPSSIRDAVLID